MHSSLLKEDLREPKKLAGYLRPCQSPHQIFQFGPPRDKSRMVGDPYLGNISGLPVTRQLLVSWRG